MRGERVEADGLVAEAKARRRAEVVLFEPPAVAVALERDLEGTRGLRALAQKQRLDRSLAEAALGDHLLAVGGPDDERQVVGQSAPLVQVPGADDRLTALEAIAAAPAGDDPLDQRRRVDRR